MMDCSTTRARALKFVVCTIPSPSLLEPCKDRTWPCSNVPCRAGSSLQPLDPDVPMALMRTLESVPAPRRGVVYTLTVYGRWSAACLAGSWLLAGSTTDVVAAANSNHLKHQADTGGGCWKISYLHSRAEQSCVLDCTRHHQQECCTCSAPSAQLAPLLLRRTS